MYVLLFRSTQHKHLKHILKPMQTIISTNIHFNVFNYIVVGDEVDCVCRSGMSCNPVYEESGSGVYNGFGGF